MRRRPDPVLLELFEQAGRNVQRTSLMLRDMLADFPESSGLARDIYVCEQEGDRITHDILHRRAERGDKRSHMDAADVHALSVALDDIVDYAEEAADQLGRYGVEPPMSAAEEIAAVLVAASEQVACSLRQLRTGSEPASRGVDSVRLDSE